MGSSPTFSTKKEEIMENIYNYDGIMSYTFAGLVDELNKRNIPRESIVSVFTNTQGQYIALYETKH